jgi:hypothetical protein
MKFAEPIEFHRKSGMWGTLVFVEGSKGPVGICGLFSESDRWASPSVFVPGTLGRTWGTRLVPCSRGEGKI